MTGVLLVDDEPLVLIGMQGMLNWAALGYEVVGTARNGAEALRAVQEKQPDIVVSDIRMPVMDGFALAEACHKDGSALPAFIMLTSYEEFDYVKRSMRLGVVDYLVKIDLTADGLTAALLGTIICLLQRKVMPVFRNAAVFQFLTSLLIGSIGCFAVRLLPVLNIQFMMSGAIMLLIQGLALTNSVRDMLVGHTISGLLRLSESLLLAGALALGFGGAMFLFGV